MTVNTEARERWTNPEAFEDVCRALEDAVALVSVVHGEGPDAIIPERLPTRLGVGVKAADIVRDAQAALARARGES